MLTPLLNGSYKNHMEQANHDLGVPVKWVQTKAPFDTKDNVLVGFKHVGWREEELVNAYGVGAIIVTINVTDIPLVEKFDKIELGEERYTLAEVFPIYITGEQVFWKSIVQGK